MFEIKDAIESQAMKEVREWKQIRNDEVAGLPAREAISRMMDLAEERSGKMIERMKRLKADGARLEFKKAPNDPAGTRTFG